MAVPTLRKSLLNGILVSSSRRFLSSSARLQNDSTSTKKRALTEPIDTYVVNKTVSAEETVARWPAAMREVFTEGEAGLKEADLKDITRALDRLGDGIIEMPESDPVVRPSPRSYWFDPDDPETRTHDIEGDKFEENDISPLAHAKLEEIREEREYMRVMAWEMPLLSKFAKPFKPPTGTQVLRFRYTTYLGEDHPAQAKVVVQFSTRDLGLTEQQQRKLAKLAGPRYNPQTHIVKMSCESFPHQAQNKRFLSDQIDKLIEAAKDPTDTFEDVPLDTRHHKWVSKPKWPKSWNLSPTRRAALLSEQESQRALDMARDAEGRLIDGKQILEKHLFKVTGVAPSTVGDSSSSVSMPELGGKGVVKNKEVVMA